MLARMVSDTFIKKTDLQKSAPKCPFDRGSEGQKLFRQFPNRRGNIFKGASLVMFHIEYDY